MNSLKESLLALTTREYRALDRLAQGATPSEIALEEGISSQAVNTRLQRAIKKLGARNVHHAVAIAIKRGLVEVGGS